MAAAWAACNGSSDTEATAAGVAVAVANGYPADAVSVVPGGSDTWIATIDTGVDTHFAPAIGAGSRLDTQVAAQARGACPPGENLPALFAGSTTCADKTFEFAGSGNTINGDIHSNDDIKFGGTNDVNGQGTYVGATQDPDKITWNPALTDNPDQTTSKPFPVNYVISDYSPTTVGGSRTATSDFFFSSGDINKGWLESQNLYDETTKVIQPGTYYSSTGFDLGSLAGARGTVTLVTPGQIKISPSDLDIRPYQDGLLLFSNYNPGNCDTFGIDISGSDNDWEGVIYAPHSQVKYQGSSGFTFNGSIIANTLYLSGSGFTLTSPDAAAPGEASILLLR